MRSCASFPSQAGDLIALDDMLVAAPPAVQRAAKLLVAIGEMVGGEDERSRTGPQARAPVVSVRGRTGKFVA